MKYRELPRKHSEPDSNDTRVTDELLAGARQAGAKVVLAGNDRQLASIERGGLFAELRSRFTKPTYCACASSSSAASRCRRDEVGRRLDCKRQHVGEQALGQQIDGVGEQAEHQAVDEMRDRLRVVAARAQALGKLGEPAGGFLGQRLAGGRRAPLVGVGPARLEQRADVRVAQVFKAELAAFADGVG